MSSLPTEGSAPRQDEATAADTSEFRGKVVYEIDELAWQSFHWRRLVHLVACGVLMAGVTPLTPQFWLRAIPFVLCAAAIALLSRLRFPQRHRPCMETGELFTQSGSLFLRRPTQSIVRVQWASFDATGMLVALGLRRTILPAPQCATTIRVRHYEEADGRSVSAIFSDAPGRLRSWDNARLVALTVPGLGALAVPLALIPSSFAPLEILGRVIVWVLMFVALFPIADWLLGRAARYPFRLDPPDVISEHMDLCALHTGVNIVWELAKGPPPAESHPRHG